MQESLYNLCMGCMEKKTVEGKCPLCGYSPNSPYLPSYLPPGITLNNRYILGKLLHYNGESAEYIGFDTVTHSKVIIKEYMPDTLCTRIKGSAVISVNQNCAAQYKAFMSEFVELNKSLSKMRTVSHINPAIDMFGDNNTGYVIFKYIEGQTLSQYLRDNAGYLTWDETKKLFSPIFTTLSLVHNVGIIHRGLSPENIIIGKDETKLTGFCIADERTANTELAPEIYSGYAAPEQYSSSNWQGTWTDVYGICALLYRTLTGSTPTDASERIAQDNLAAPCQLNSNIPANVSKVIMSGMNMSGELRIQTVTELVTQLFEEPEFNHAKTTSQTITIPKYHSTESTSRSNRSKKKAPTKHSVFIIAGVSATVVMFFAMVMLISGLDDSSSKLTGIQTTASVESESLISSDTDGEGTSADEIEAQLSDATVSTTPTLAVLETSDSTADDTDTEESTAAQTTVKSGSTVYIMNDLVGKSYDTVKNSSAISSLTIVPEYVYTDEYEKGIIIDQSIPKGTNYEQGAECILSISQGPGQVIIPEFYGLDKKSYFALLNNAGIKYEEMAYETTQILDGYVAWISVDPGEYIDIEAGEVLSVFVAVNPESTGTSEATTTSEPAFSTITASETTTVTTTADTQSPWQTEAPTTEEPDIIISDDY
ncbi:MAG: PASTA domain-containing protein [Oscillospiraceae bacterium]|nr:PASTA domain-containing protein [Oscillospiraceae bacterium]